MKPRTTPPSSAPKLSAHRIARFCKLAQMALLRAAHFLASVACAWAPLERAIEEAARPFARKMTRAVFVLIALKAAIQMKRRAGAQGRTPQFDKPRGKRKADRALFGSRLRRLAKAKDPRAKIALLLTLLTHIDAHAARLAKRLANGLTRRRGGVLLEACAPVSRVQSVFAPLALRDTS